MKKILYIILILFLTNQTIFAGQEEAMPYIKMGDSNLSKYEKKMYSIKDFYLNEAEFMYKRAIDCFPQSFEAYLGLGRVYTHKNLTKYAENNFMIAYNIKPDNPRINLYIGDLYFKEKQFITALRYYQDALKCGYSNNYQANYQLALCYDKLGDSKKAKQYYQKALKINPKSSDVKVKLEELKNN